MVATPLEDPIIARTGSRQWRSLIGWLLVATIGALLVCGFTEFPVWIPAAVGAVLMLALAVLQRRISLTQIVGDLSVPLFVFVVAMTMLVQAIETQFLTGREITPPLSLPGQIAGGVMAATMASNVINNVPATVIVGEVLATLPSGPREIMAYASLVGANIGPALTTYGSLATMLWLSILRKRGLDISSRRYLRVSLVTVPAVLLTTSLALWVSLA